MEFWYDARGIRRGWKGTGTHIPKRRRSGMLPINRERIPVSRRLVLFFADTVRMQLPQLLERIDGPDELGRSAADCGG